MTVGAQIAEAVRAHGGAGPGVRHPPGSASC